MKSLFLLALVGLSSIAIQARPDAPRHPSAGLPNVYSGRPPTTQDSTLCECPSTRHTRSALRAGVPNVFAGRTHATPPVKTARR